MLDVHHEMMRLTLSVVAKTLFDAEVEQEADEIGAALTSLVDLFPTLMNPMANLLRTLPLPLSTFAMIASSFPDVARRSALISAMLALAVRKFVTVESIFAGSIAPVARRRDVIVAES